MLRCVSVCPRLFECAVIWFVRLARPLFGGISGFVGLISIATAAMLLGAPLPDELDHPGIQVVLRVFNVLISEMLFAFGTVAILLGIDSIRPQAWIERLMERLWSRAIFFALALPAIGIVVGVGAWAIGTILGK